MSNDVYKTLQGEMKNLSRDIEALEYQLAEKRKALELLRDVSEKIKGTSVVQPRRRTKQPISDMIIGVLNGKKKAQQPKTILEGLGRAGYVGSPAVMYATLGRLVKAGKLARDDNGGYMIAG